MQYIIDKNTILIIKDANNTIIYDNNEKHIIKKKINDVLNECCKYYGSSLKGRIEGTNYLLGSIYKAPIIISEYNEIIMFPAASDLLHHLNVMIVCGLIMLGLKNIFVMIIKLSLFLKMA